MPSPTHSPTRRSAAAATIAAVAFGLAGCADNPPGSPGPPIGVTAAPRPITVEWAGHWCTALAPLLESVRDQQTPPASRPALLDRLTSVRQAWRATAVRLSTVHAPPVDKGQVVADELGEELGAFRRGLDGANAQLRSATSPQQAAAAAARARSVLGSFGPAQIERVLHIDPEVRDATQYAPSCTELSIGRS